MPETWEVYEAQAAAALGKLWHGEITCRQSDDMLPPRPAFVAEEVHDFIADMVWEIDGFRSEIRGLLDLLESGASQDRVVAYIEWVG